MSPFFGSVRGEINHWRSRVGDLEGSLHSVMDSLDKTAEQCAYQRRHRAWALKKARLYTDCSEHYAARAEAAEAERNVLERELGTVDAVLARREALDGEKAALLDAAKAYAELNACYRLSTHPTEALHMRLEKAGKLLRRHKETEE